MHARSALFDVYGDHLRTRQDRASIAALVRLLETVGIRAPAVRTAVSRMVAQGWLEPASIDGARGYAATARAVVRLDQAGDRIYRRLARAWDGGWHLVLLPPCADRTLRQRLHRELTFLGYAELADRTWVSPGAGPGLEEALAGCDVDATTATLREVDPPDAPLAAWDLDALAAAYDAWLAEAPRLIAARLADHDDPDEGAFAARFEMVHEWRKFLFLDPGLPDELLPASWPGRTAATWFTGEADRLAGASDRWVARVLAGP